LNEDIEKAAKAAYAYNFIQSFPDKFDTKIGELGSRLSGGMLVQKALENLMKGRTTFVIAHRLSTIGYANRIVVIIKGKIVEEGKHEDLISLKGEYYKLYQSQFNNKKIA